ncbi:D(2) dopamine receptor-like [Mytilus californianus]|uniref:D(2) dopamine receptor-like n=1 Tax=Mytilus californianus TaxID=6549 RepID=UPI00224734E2|nr:D(2) dopamine receptor-like [Mytilus californianus]
MSNKTEDLPEFLPSSKNITIIITLTTLVLVTIIGNLIVLLAFIKESKLRKEAFNYFIFNLAITDFLVAITAMTFYTIDTVLGYWPFGPAMCAFWIYADYAMTFASVFTLTAISIDRFWSVTWPIHYRNNSTIKKTIIMIAIVWVCVFTIWTPPFIGDRLNHNEEYSCIWEPNENREFIIVVDVIGHYLPCSLMVISYIKVLAVMRKRGKIKPKNHVNVRSTRNEDYTNNTTVSSINSKIQDPTINTQNKLSNDTTKSHDKNVTNNQIVFVSSSQDYRPLASDQQTSTSSSQTSQRMQRENRWTNDTKDTTDEVKYNKSERKIFITLSYVVLSYLIFWFPFYVTWDIYAFHPDLVPPLLYTVMFWMTYINSTLNPIIYAYTNKDFRRSFWKIMRCKF